MATHHNGGMADPTAAPWELMRLMDGFVTTQVLYAAAELGLADELSTGPMTATELAERLNVNARSLAQMLRWLTIEGVLVDDDAGRFALTPTGEALQPLRGAAVVRGAVYYSAASGLLDCLRTDGIPFERAYGERFFDHLDRDPAHQAAFEASMSSRGHQEAAAVTGALANVTLGRVVDVGGGRGVLLAHLLAADRDAHGILVDRPDVVPVAERYLAEAGVADRVSVMAADFFVEVPAGHDTYVLSRVLHDWTDVDARRILQRCRAAIPDHGQLLVVEAALPRRARDTPAAVRMDLHMFLLFGGGERTEQEYGALLADTGFQLNEVLPTGSMSGLTVIRATPS
jgi:hypothetical protein